MYEKERQQIIDVGIALDRYRLISLSGGNVSMRIDGHILVTPSGMSYETLVPADVVVMSPQGKVVEGERRPSVDTVALLHIFNNMPEVNAVIQTHQPYATAVGLVMDELPAFCTVQYIGDRRAVILRNHGVVTVGPTLKDALYAAVYLEDASRSYCAARAMGTPRCLAADQVAEAVESFRHYGQGRK